MLWRLVSVSFFLYLSVVIDPAYAWVEQVAAETEKAANDARCVGFVAYNDMVHILNAPSDRALMSAAEERTAVIDLTRAISDIGRFRVTRGGALPYEAVTRANTPAGREELSSTLQRLSEAAITVFFAPYARDNGVVRAEVTLLLRRHDQGRPILACTPTVWVDIPVGVGVEGIGGWGGSGGANGIEGRIVAFVEHFHEMANRPGSCIEMGQFYAPMLVVDGQTRTRGDQVRLRCDIERLNPEIHLHDGSVRITPIGNGRYRVSYTNTARVDDRGTRATTDWFVDSVIELRDGRLQYTRIDPTSRRR